MPDTLLTLDLTVGTGVVVIEPTSPLPPTSPPPAHDYTLTGKLTLDLTAEAFVNSTITLASATDHVSYTFSRLENLFFYTPPAEFPGADVKLIDSTGGAQFDLGILRIASPNRPVQSWADFDNVLVPQSPDSNGSLPGGNLFVAGLVTLTPEPLVIVNTPEPAAWVVLAAALVVALGCRQVRALLA